MNVTVGIPTKNRYNSLSQTLLSIALQTLPPKEVIIIDDSDNPTDIRQIPEYQYILSLFDDKRVNWVVNYGKKKGQHHSHQLVNEIAKGDLIFRIDDDEVAESDTIEKLSHTMIANKDVGAIAPSVLMPNPAPLPEGLRNNIYDLSTPNVQWFRGTGIREADHLYSCFMYRKGINNYDLSLSTVCHREETIFTYGIKRLGYRLLIDSDAVVWHFRGAEGGIRTFRDPGLWDHDEKIFKSYLNLWGVDIKSPKWVVLDCGLGDHYAFKNILPELMRKYDNVRLAVCFPDAFSDVDGISLTSIAEAKLTFGNIDNFNIYKMMIDWNWSGTLENAFRKLYLA